MSKTERGSDASRTLTVQTQSSGAENASAHGWVLYVLRGTNVVKSPLPARGRVVIGRTREADVVIDDPSVSRKHAALEIDERGVRVEDLGGTNPVQVADRPVRGGSVAIDVGTVMRLGDVMVVLQRSAPDPSELASHAELDAMVRRLAADLVTHDKPFALLHVRVDHGEMAAAREAVASVLRPRDAIAAYAPSVFEILLPDTRANEATALADRMRRVTKSRGIVARIGLARAPEDGRSPDALLAKCSDEIAGREESPRPTADTWLARQEPTLARIARGDISVLVVGETGAGKELVAETVHRLSPRAGKPLVRLNCAGFSETLLASELFGHERGAFTGAERAKPGLLETAEGGTVMLDEIGEIPLALQPKLLRVLEDRQVLRLGALKSKPIDVRFVAATNRDLEDEVAAGRFRQDLYYRVAGHVVFVPPLRERGGEVIALARHFAKNVALAPDAIELLEQYAWPGNVRELRNVIERAVLLCDGPLITAEHLPAERMRARRATASPAPDDDALRAALADRERQKLLDTLAACGGNQTRAARMLGIARGTLLARMDAFGLARPRKR